MKMRFTALSIAMLTGIAVDAQVTITQLSVPYTENFNGLSDTTLTNPHSTLPAGWTATEVGTGADATYRAAWGQYAGGDLYSFGDSAVQERALGSVGSGTVAPVYFGIAIVNNTGGTIQDVRVKYTGELWRAGNPARSTGPDSLHVAYGTNNGTLTTGVWNNAAYLNFISPASSTGPSNIQLNGNANANKVNIDDTLKGINLAQNDTLWIRWMDHNSSSFDDGMGIDDVSITFLPTSTSNTLAFTAFNTYYYQDFDVLGNVPGATPAFSTLPTGWFASETGTNADQTYRVAIGEFAGGNTYSFGDSNSSERALGSIGSGSLNISHYGSAWINKTGQTINNVEVKFTGEMWRQGRPARSTGPDTLHFSYATSAKSIDTGNYINLSTLDFYSPVTNGTLNTPMNGNLAANQTKVANVIANLSLQPNDTLWIRWTDYDSDSYDDGLAIDSFAIAAVSAPVLLSMEFAEENSTFSEAEGTVKVPLHIHNKSNFISQVEVFIADTGNIDIATDLIISSGYVTFPGSTNDTVASFSFGIKNTQPFEADEYFVLGIRNAVNGTIGQTIYDTIHVINYSYPAVAISNLAGDDAQGLPDSVGRTFEIEGIVHGVNYSASNGLDFYVIQNGAGINVYQPQAGTYTPTAGDKVKAWGAIGYFRGLTRFEAIDSIQKISSNNSLETPKKVTSLTEAEESAYLQLDSVKLYPALNAWPRNLEVYAVQVSTNDTIAIYVSDNTDLPGEIVPTGYFSITGIGSQFNNTTTPPYNNGYRLMAISKANIARASVSKMEQNNQQSIRLYPNPFVNQLTIESDGEIQSAKVYSLDGKCIWKTDTNGNKITVNPSNWNTGIYILHTTGANNTTVNKIIKL
ncbi:MAG TPA: T9SS type A sorting domain-containing protein [Flavipsychrobacter sp.]